MSNSMNSSDLKASRWASPDVRRERQAQISAWRRTPSPHKTTTNNNVNHNATYAPATSVTAPAKLLSSVQRTYIARDAELHRFRKLFRRLAWKANSLTHWSHRALNLAQEYQQSLQQGYPQESAPRAVLGGYEMMIDPIEAERQFKIDFYEFYALLERGLVCLLGIWGIVITASANSTTTTQNSGTTNAIIGDSLSFHGTQHRFHANVLSALEHPSNPLHSILGTGPVHSYIGVAKEFRNKWKDVEQRPEDAFRGHERVEEEWDSGKLRKFEKVLRDLRLEELLGFVLAGLEEAGRRGEREVERLAGELGEVGRQGVVGHAGGVIGTVAGDHDLDMQDAPFESGSMGGQGVVDYEMEF